MSSTTRRSEADLAALSDEALLARVRSLTARERETTLEVLRHLNEIERRRLHEGLGYASLWAYCTEHLRYSASAAGRRIRAARCIRRHRRVATFLGRGDVTLATINLVANVLTEKNHDALLAEIRGKSQREVEKIAARFGAPSRIRDRVRPVRVAHPEPARPDAVSSQLSVGEAAPSATAERAPDPHSRSGSAEETRSQSLGETGRTEPAKRERDAYEVRFVASRRFMKKYAAVAALCSHRVSRFELEGVLELALDAYLDRHSPERRDARRRARHERRQAQAAPRRKNEAGSGARGARKPVPADVRDVVFLCDGGRCTFVGPGGRRCTRTTRLHFDHIEPAARGGPSTVENGRLLCDVHNQLEARRVFGEAFMAARRTRAGSRSRGSDTQGPPNTSRG